LRNEPFKNKNLGKQRCAKGFILELHRLTPLSKPKLFSWVELSALDKQKHYARYAHICVSLPIGRPGKDITLCNKSRISPRFTSDAIWSKTSKTEWNKGTAKYLYLPSEFQRTRLTAQKSWLTAFAITCD
jgi:hypothetical protein